MKAHRSEGSSGKTLTSEKPATAVHQTANSLHPGEIEVECGPLEAQDRETWRPQIELLKRLHNVRIAAELHPGLAFADKEHIWPSSTFGAVSSDVLELLRRARADFTVRGFAVEADPINPLGDGKSWVLVLEQTRNLPLGTDPLEIAERCQSQFVTGVPRPVWDGDTILVPVWNPRRGVQEQSPRKHSGRPKSKPVAEREEAIKKAASSGKTGREYCIALGAFPTPYDWQKRHGCPKNYVEAWDHPTKSELFRQLIAAEKHRFAPGKRSRKHQ